MDENVRFRVLLEAKENGGVYNLYSKRPELKKGKTLIAIEGAIAELLELGFLTQVRNTERYTITMTGKEVVELGSFEAYRAKLKESPDLNLINETFKEIAKIHSETKSGNKLVTRVSIVTAAAIIIQTIFTVIPYFSEEPVLQPDLLIMEQKVLIDSLSFQVNRYRFDMDSLSVKFQELSTNKDSTFKKEFFKPLKI